MELPKIPLDNPLLSEKEKERLIEVIESGWLTWRGPFVRKFEERYAKFVGTKHAIAVCNGTAALLLALKAIGLRPGDKVIVPTFTFSGTAFVVSTLGGKVLFSDCEPKRFVIDPNEIEKIVKREKKVKAIIPVHMYGWPAKMDMIREIAEDHQIFVIEDSAQAIGTEYKGFRTGSMGTIGCFSFHNKQISTGEGGMITTNDEKIADKIRYIMNPAPYNYTEIPEIQFNFRMSSLQAAVGIAQLERIDELITRRRTNAKLYREMLSNVKGIEFVNEEEWEKVTYWRCNILVTKSFPMSRNELAKYLLNNNIEARPTYLPLHKHPYYIKAVKEKYPNAELIAEMTLDLPSSPTLSEEQIEYICSKIKEVSNH
jgi:perosamine synthetase